MSDVNDIAIFGAGGFGKEVAQLIREINAHCLQWNIIGFFDDQQHSKSIAGLPYLGGVGELNEQRENLAVVVAVASPADRKKIVESITASSLSFPSLIHPTAVVGSTSNQIKRGCIITAGCILTTDIFIDEFVIINLATTIGHDVRIERFSSIMPGARISGAVSIGEGTLIGTGAMILQNHSIGAFARVGAGAVVTRNVMPKQTVVGVPARDVNSTK